MGHKGKGNKRQVNGTYCFTKCSLLSVTNFNNNRKGCKQNKSQGWEKESAVHVSSRINPTSPSLARRFYIHFYSVEFYLSVILQSIGRRGLDPGIGRDSSFRAVVRLFGREHGRRGAEWFRINESKFFVEVRISRRKKLSPKRPDPRRTSRDPPFPGASPPLSFPSFRKSRISAVVDALPNVAARAHTHTHERKD